MNWKTTAAAAGCLVVGAAVPAQAATVRPNYTPAETTGILVKHDKPQGIARDGSEAVTVSALVAPGTYGWCWTHWGRYDSGTGWEDLGLKDANTSFADRLERDHRYEYTARAVDCSHTEGPLYQTSSFYRSVLDNANSLLTFSSGWKNMPTTQYQAYASSYRQATKIGSTVTTDYECFYGFAPIVTVQPGGAKIDVLVNGVKRGTVNTASSSKRYRWLVTGFGSNTPGAPECGYITLRVASAGKAGVDALIVFGQ